VRSRRGENAAMWWDRQTFSRTRELYTVAAREVRPRQGELSSPQFSDQASGVSEQWIRNEAPTWCLNDPPTFR